MGDGRQVTAAPDELGEELWSPTSWRNWPRSQQPDWSDRDVLESVTGMLRSLPPLVTAARVARLRLLLAAAADGRLSVLQAGPCVESFRDDPRIAVDGLAVLLQRLTGMLRARADARGRPGHDVVCIARAAGQYAKPRSSATEMCDGQRLPVFRGHFVHDDAPSEAARRPDPRRLRTGFARAGETVARLRVVAPEMFVSHEALLLEYEEGLTRRVRRTGQWYAGSGDLLWVGERTRGLDEAHIRFLAGVMNPVGCKLGPSAAPQEVVELCARLDPDRAPGRLTLIPRLGAGRVGNVLPGLVRAVSAAGHRVVWLCDPMHGNTRTGPDGKRRFLADIRAEVEESHAVHEAQGSWLAGLHLEVTAEDVNECVDEASGGSPPRKVTSLCDPRLNTAQALAVVGSLIGASSGAHGSAATSADLLSP